MNPMPEPASARVPSPAGVAPALSTGRGHRIGLLDRPWVGSWSCLLVSPVTARPIEEIQAAVLALFERCPDHPLISQVDAAAARWRPVRAGDAQAYCAQVVVASPEPGPGGEDAFITANTPTASWRAPFRVLVGPRTTTLYMNHVLGDATTLSRLTHGLITADVDELVSLGARADCGILVARLANDVRHRQAHYRRPRPVGPRSDPDLGADSNAGVESSPGVAVTGSDEAYMISQVVDNVAVRQLLKWRNRHAAGVALSSLLTSAIYLSLVSAGLTIDRSGYYSLINVRRYLNPADQERPGNLAKSLFIAVDPGDPKAVEAAFGATLDSGWALPSTLYGTVVSALPRPPMPVKLAGAGRAGVNPGAQEGQTPAPITLSISVMPSMPGIEALPWSGSTDRRCIGGGGAKAGPSLNLFAVRMRAQLELAATFRTMGVRPDLVRAALVALGDPVTVLESSRPSPDENP